MSEAKIVNLPTICQSFPEVSVCGFNINKDATSFSIDRDNFLDAIDTLFEGGNQLVTIEGEEGNGKTTLVSQFALRYDNNAICLFIKSTSKLGYDQLALLFDLCNQIEWILNKELIRNPELASESYLRSQILRLQQYARWKHQTYYFVIDGINEIPSESSYVKDWLFELLPFGFSSFKFLITEDLDKIPNLLKKNCLCKSMPLTGFTLYETVRYFEDLSLNKTAIEEIYRNFKKPGHLAAVKRLLVSVDNVDEFINDMPKKLHGLFEIEWENARINEIQSKILGIVVFDRNQTIDSISNLLNIEYEQVISLIKNLNFICINPESGVVSFVSESYKKFTTAKLTHLKEEITDVIMNYLLRRPDSEEALVRLPDFFAQKGKYVELVQYLNTDNFTELMNRSQSVGIIKQKLDLGIVHAKINDNVNDYIRFCMQKAVINEIANSDVWLSEIETRIAMNDYETALVLAQNSVLKEDRLHSLALLARKKREQGLVPEPEVIEHIKRLYDQIDYLSLGEKAIEIAADLIYTKPELAIELVEKSTNTSDGDNSLDIAYSKLAISALSKTSRSKYNDFVSNINFTINNSSIKGLNAGIRVLIGDHEANEVILEVEKLDGISNRIFLLRQWIQQNSFREDAIDVVEYAFKLTINATEYAPNARVYREISIPLPQVVDRGRLKNFIGLLDSQKDAIEKLGPSEEYVRLQMLIAEAEFGYDVDAASNRLSDMYLYILDISDLSVKCGCMVWLVVFLFNIDREMLLEKKDGILSLALNDLNADIECLLNTTADHFNVTKGVISALARSNIDLAFSIAMKLNTQNRRDLALFTIIKYSIKDSNKDIDFGYIIKAFESINFCFLKDKCFMEIINWAKETDAITKEQFEKLNPIIYHFSELYSATDRCIACSTLYTLLKKKISNVSNIALEDELLNQISEAWKAVDPGSEKVNLGFRIAESLFENIPEVAKNYFDAAEEYKENSIINTIASERAFMVSLDLAIRAFGGLVTKKTDVDEDFEKLTKLLNMIPNQQSRIILWFELAIRYYLSQRKDDFNKIVNRYMKPLLKDIKISDTHEYFSTLCSIAPALYSVHNLTAHDQLSELPYELIDIAYMNICHFIFRKCSPSDPYESSSSTVYTISYEETINLCDILTRMNNDTAIYEVIANICNSVSSRKVFYSQQQRNDIATKLKDIINKKLPNPRYIEHDGYKIIAFAQVANMEKAKEIVWDKLIEDACKISNLADQAYVLCIIAILMSKSSAQKAIIRRAKELVEKIPSAYDKADRYETLGQLTWDTDKDYSKECYLNAMKFASKSDNQEAIRVQRKIIDSTYRVDPELAGSLASLLDNDEARKERKENLKHRLEILKLRKCIEDEDYRNKGASPTDTNDFQEASIMLLGSLNSGRLAPVPLEYTYKYVYAATSLQIFEAYPLLAWVIENAVKKINNLNQTSSQLRPIFESMILSTELALRIAEDSMNITNKNRKSSSNVSSNQSEIIKPGERDNAIKFLLKWLKDSMGEYVKICDPYFGLKDLEIIQLIQTVDSRSAIKILTSIKIQDKARVEKPWEEAYVNFWRANISDQDPPETDFVIVGTEKSGELPIHDRWIVTKNGGLRIGTSFNSLGITKCSEISTMSTEEAQMIEDLIDQYLTHNKKEHNGDRLKYTHFNL